MIRRAILWICDHCLKREYAEGKEITKSPRPQGWSGRRYQQQSDGTVTETKGDFCRNCKVEVLKEKVNAC